MVIKSNNKHQIPNKFKGLGWPELTPGTLIKRYKRFLARLFKPADHIDPDYGRGLRRAVLGGVEILAYDVSIDLKGIKFDFED